MESRELIQECINNDAKAQEELYRRFAPKMYGICMRFAKNRAEADDILQEGFIRVFGNLNKFRAEGALEAWIRRTVINTAINYYNSNLRFSKDTDIEKYDFADCSYEDAISQISTKELLKMVQELPKGYRKVFNLYTIEGYSHKEISEMLDISVNTSKSQLTRARGALRKKYQSVEYNSNILSSFSGFLRSEAEPELAMAY